MSFYDNHTLCLCERISCIGHILVTLVTFDLPGMNPSPWAIESDLDKIYFNDIIKLAKKEDYKPVEQAETPDHLWLPRLTDGQKKFREVQQILSGYGIAVQDQDELVELAEMWKNRLGKT